MDQYVNIKVIFNIKSFPKRHSMNRRDLNRICESPVGVTLCTGALCAKGKLSQDMPAAVSALKPTVERAFLLYAPGWC